MAHCTYIDGIASSQAIDTAGEIVDLSGLDCSSLLGAAFNWEHKSDVPAQIVGKVLEYKKIFSEKDCDTDRQKLFWQKCKIPFLYVLGRLLDDKKDSAREVAALFQDDAENPNEPQMLGFSIEGAKIHKEGMTITRSIARKVTITNLPANKTCAAEKLPEQKEAKNVDSLFKGEIEFFKPTSNYLEFLEKREKDMEKDDALIGGSLQASEKLEKGAPSWSPGKKSGDAVHFSHPEHGTVSIHKQPTGEFHVKHQGKLAGMGGVKGSFKTAGEAGTHAKNYMGAISGKKILAPQMHNAASASMLHKALEAGSSNAAPSALVQGAALGKEDLKKVGPSFGNFNGKKKKPAEDGVASVSSMTSINVGSVAQPGAGQGGAGLGKSAKSKSKWLARAEEAYKTWEKKEQFEKFMKDKLPHLSKGEVKAIGQTLALKKSMDAEDTLSKICDEHYKEKK